MKCFVFSIGEKTTDLCCKLMREYGFEVILYQDQTSLWEKLKRFYTEALATEDQEFVRIDADIIPNKNVKEFLGTRYGNRWWMCASGFDFYKQDLGAISIHRMERPIIELCLQYIDTAKNKSRPESQLWRHEEINMDTGVADEFCFGLHGYGQGDQRQRIKDLKYIRNQKYEWELLDRIEAL